MRIFHFSYDTIDCKKHFDGNHDEARRFLLCVLGQTPIELINSYNESTFILHYKKYEPKLFAYLKKNLSKYFYFTISLVTQNNEGKDFIEINPNDELDSNFTVDWLLLNCDNLNKNISDY